MNTEKEQNEPSPHWFVGASYGSTDDQTARFYRDGTWDCGNQDKYKELIKSVHVGDRIAIKSSYTRKQSLPFDNRGHWVSVVAIKAIGTVTENPGDGFNLKVDWKPFDKPREWYFYTNRNTVWRVVPTDWITQGLIDFTFHQKDQDIERFANEPYWRSRFGDIASDPANFKWIPFYEEIAAKLEEYRDRRSDLVAGIHEIASRIAGVTPLSDKFHDGSRADLADICPFTVIGIFNRGNTDTNRKKIAGELAKFLGVTEPVPDSFEGIPILNNQRSWFFGYSHRRQAEDIDLLWDIFVQGLAFADSGINDPQVREDFKNAYDRATHCYGVAWNLTIGLYWIRPQSFVTLDKLSQNYIDKRLNIAIGRNGPKRLCNATDYLKVVDQLNSSFQESDYPVHSFPALSLAAWRYEDSKTSANLNATEPDLEGDAEDEVDQIAPVSQAVVKIAADYTINDILNDGCFIAQDQLHNIIERLRDKKNIILQGPPGTGKTWLAKRLAYALMGKRDESKVKAVQFHPNVSYEDFIRGWRPKGDGKLDLIDGVFMQVINAAKHDDQSIYVIVIEEINRGNPAQIFGEMLTLLEADKRDQREALELSYKREGELGVYIPKNVYVIGTMNIADRSLALVDLALRRRFAFIDVKPTFGSRWLNWVSDNNGADIERLKLIEERISQLNKTLAEDPSLGPQFQVGHSYVTPPSSMKISDTGLWFKQVVETEIEPLLNEYWFDAADTARKAKQKLLEGFD